MPVDLKANVFYSSRFERSAEYAEHVVQLLAGSGFHATSTNIDMSTEQWSSLGLMSVPAIVIYRSERPISNLVAYSSDAEILQRLRTVQTQSTDDPDGDIRQATLDTAEQWALRGLNRLPYYVSGSSGTHRYARWHEDFLASDDASPGSGWCGPSGRSSEDYLILSFPACVQLTGLEFLPRIRTDGIPSWKSLPKGITIHNGENKDAPIIWESNCIKFNAEGLFVTLPEPITPTDILIRVTAKNDIHGKAFPAIRRIRPYGIVLSDQEGRLRVKPGKLRSRTESGSILKYGIYNSGQCQLEQFSLASGRMLPTSICSGERVVYVVSGSLKAEGLNCKSVISSMDSLTIPTNYPLSLVAAADSHFLMLYSTCDCATVWEAR